MKILLVDDENILIYSLQDFFKQKKTDALFINSSLKALELVKKENFDIVITDIKMPEMDGLELLKEIKNFSPDTEVIIITNYRTTDNAITALKSGAIDFLSKPVNKNEIWLAIEKANRYIELKKTKNSFEQRLCNYETQTQNNNGNFQIIGESPQILKIRDLIKKIAATPDVTVLITGESGTGKDLTARNIHWQSERSNNPYIAINCSSFTPSLIESELFGYEKGAFTGASTLKKGLVEYADTGSLFLDEIGDMPLELQGAFLRVLENKQIRRLG
ncbi:MAG TPA: sigma-54 dependent transcriptional regulator, partial [bacterium]|nr:sigma-54 dependent transcriptional regulator [bacterium]